MFELGFMTVTIVCLSYTELQDLWNSFLEQRQSECRIKPLLRNKPDHFILHVGTKDSGTGATIDVRRNGATITDVATLLTNEQHDIGNVVNKHLSELCQEKNTSLIDHSQKAKPRHLNKNKLHLNKNGAVLSN